MEPIGQIICLAEEYRALSRAYASALDAVIQGHDTMTDDELKPLRDDVERLKTLSICKADALADLILSFDD